MFYPQPVGNAGSAQLPASWWGSWCGFVGVACPGRVLRRHRLSALVSVEDVVDDALQFGGAGAEVAAGGVQGGVAEEGLDVGDVGAALA